MKRRLVVGALPLLLAVAGVTAPMLRSARVEGGADVPLYAVARGEFVREVWAEGNLEAVQATRLGPPPDVRQPLKIAWLAPDGSRVEAGDVVIRFDPTDLEKNLTDGERERAQVDSRMAGKRATEEAQQRNLGRDAEMAELELEYARNFRSKDPTIFSRADIIESEIDETLALERKDHALEAARTRESLAQAELDLLGIERRKAVLKIEQASRGLAALEVAAPHDGIFVLKSQWGRRPEVGQTVWGGQPLAELPQLDAMQVKLHVLEADAGGLVPGLSATVRLEAHPDRTYDGTVSQVDALAQPRNYQTPIQYFGVMLALERTDTEVMKPGARVRAVVTVDRRDGALTVPRQAVFERDGRQIVWLRRGNGFEPSPVTLGPAGAGLVVIESGVAEGDRVALRDPTEAPAGPGDADGNGSSATLDGRPGAG